MWLNDLEPRNLSPRGTVKRLFWGVSLYLRAVDFSMTAFPGTRAVLLLYQGRLSVRDLA